MKTIFVFVITTALCYCDPNVQRAFTDSGLVPDILSNPPMEFLQVMYPSGATVGLGNVLTPTQTKEKPQVMWPAERGVYYTLVKTDPDVPSRENPSLREIRHWTVINIPGSDVEKGDEVIGYFGSGPPKETGLHRYVLLVYKQSRGKIKWKEARISNKKMAGRPMTSVKKFAQKYNLGDPIFGSFYRAEYDEYSEELSKVLYG